MEIEIITHDDDGRLLDPPRILLPDGELIKPRKGDNGWLFIVDVERLESNRLSGRVSGRAPSGRVVKKKGEALSGRAPSGQVEKGEAIERLGHSDNNEEAR